MVENLLTKAIREKIAEAVKDFRLPVKHGEARAPQVVNGYLVPKRTTAQDDFPFVIVRPVSGKRDVEETEVEVAIIVGCYSEEFDCGYEYCVNVMSRISHAFAAMENNILAGRYVLRFPISWELVSEQPAPQWQLEMKTTWIYRTPQATF